MAIASGGCQARKAIRSRQPPTKEESKMELNGLELGRTALDNTESPLAFSGRQRCQAAPEAGFAGQEEPPAESARSAQHRKTNEQNAVAELEG